MTDQTRQLDQAWAGADFTRAPSDSGIALCRSCERRGLCQLGLGREELMSDGSVETTLVCSSEHEGGPGGSAVDCGCSKGTRSTSFALLHALLPAATNNATGTNARYLRDLNIIDSSIPSTPPSSSSSTL